MYRQILVHSDDCQLQKIVYRSKPTDKLQEFILKTVTYGTKTAPYLATRCLVQLGKTCNDSEISQIIQRDFYVDDLLTGADTVEACHNIYQKLTNILTSAQLPLRKWCSNSPTLLSWLPTTTDANYLL
ncbi:Integrase catalytic domain-containing protein, partial [Aphis craccivora]